MAVVILLEALSVGRVAVRVDPLAELGFFLHAVTHGDHHPHAQEARERIHADRDDELVVMAAYFRPLYSAIRARYLVPMTLDPGEGDLGAQIDALAGLDHETFVRHSAVSLIESSRGVDLRAVSTNAAQRSEWLSRVERLSVARMELAVDIVDRPMDTLRRLCEFLHGVSDRWFRPERDRLQPQLLASVREREAALRRSGLDSLEDVAAAAVLEDEPLRLSIDKVNKATVRAGAEGVVLVPSVFISPHLVVKHDQGYPIVIAYEVGPGSVDGVDLTARRIAALSDSVRMEICRAVLKSPRTTVDLAYKMRMTQPQMSRHLRALREARLVHAERQGRLVYYSLDVGAVHGLGSQILSLLHR